MRDDDLRSWNRQYDDLRSWDRQNHDYPDYDPDGELDRWLSRGIIVLGFFGLWKILELIGWVLIRLF